MGESSETKIATTLNKDWRNEKMTMSSLTSSVKMQALAIHGDPTRSIGGRLGGHFDSSRSIDRSRLFGSGGPPTEGTRLVSIPSIDVEEDKEQGPPLSKWIAPALCCAAAYAFYNVSLVIYFHRQTVAVMSRSALICIYHCLLSFSDTNSLIKIQCNIHAYRFSLRREVQPSIQFSEV